MPEINTLEKTAEKINAEIRRDPFTGNSVSLVKNGAPKKDIKKVIAEYPYGSPAVIVGSPHEHDLIMETPPRVEGRNNNIYDSRTPTGAHEYLHCDPNHPSMLEYLLIAFKDRILGLRTIRGVRYIAAFLESKNQHDGKLVAEVVAFPTVPPAIKSELIGSSKHFDLRDNRCLWCDIIKEEIASWERVIYQNDFALSIVPYQQRYEFEAHLFPTKHTADFGYLDRHELQHLADALDQTIKKIKLHSEGDYILDIHTVPLALPPSDNLSQNKDINHFFHTQI